MSDYVYTQDLFNHLYNSQDTIKFVEGLFHSLMQNWGELADGEKPPQEFLDLCTKRVRKEIELLW